MPRRSMVAVQGAYRTHTHIRTGLRALPSRSHFDCLCTHANLMAPQTMGVRECTCCVFGEMSVCVCLCVCVCIYRSAIGLDEANDMIGDDPSIGG